MEGTEAMGNKFPKKVSSYLASSLSALTKPQKRFLPIYIAGLIWMIKFRSIVQIAGTFGKGAIDGLHQFIKGAPKKVKRLQHENQRQVAQKVHASEDPLLIIDDTPCPRNGKKVEGAGIHHGAAGLVRGLCAVTSIVKVGTQRFCWAIRGYRPKGSLKKKYSGPQKLDQ